MNLRHILIGAAFAAVLCGTANAQTTQAYPAISGSETSALYSLSANGTAVWVEKIGPGGMEDLHVAAFSCSGTQHIVIEADQPVSTFTIQPKHAGIQATADGKQLSFDIDGPGKYYIRVNDNPYLALFANDLETDVPGKKDKDVIVYGPGVHEAGRIVLQDNMSIYLAPGALVTGNISGTGKNVHIWGRGSINGNLNVNECENLCVEGIFFRSRRGWTNTINNSINTTYRDVKVFSHSGTWGLDGINPVSCDGFLIDDCFIRTRDDCIAIKAYDKPDQKILGCKNVTVQNCVLVGWDHADGVTLGFELNAGPVENIRVQNCDILKARGSGRTGGHAAFSIVCDGASDVHDIFFDNIRVESEIEYKNLEIILTEAERYGNGKMGSVKGIHISNVSWENAGKPFTIVGHPTRFVEDVTFSNCYVGGKLLNGLDDADFQIEFAKEIVFNGGEAVKVDRYPSEPFSGRVPGQRRPQ